MIKFLKDLFRRDPLKKLVRERDELYHKAVFLQRNGDLISYGKVMTRINEIEKECVRIAEETQG